MRRRLASSSEILVAETSDSGAFGAVKFEGATVAMLVLLVLLSECTGSGGTDTDTDTGGFGAGVVSSVGIQSSMLISATGLVFGVVSSVPSVSVSVSERGENTV